MRSERANRQTLGIEERRKQAYKLRIDGLSYRQIAEELGVSVGTAYSDIIALFERTKEQSDEMVQADRQVQVARLEAAVAEVMPMIRADVSLDALAEDLDLEKLAEFASLKKLKLEAVDRLVKLDARIAKLLGLEAPVKKEISGPEGAPIEVDARGELTDKLARLIAGEASEDEAGEDS